MICSSTVSALGTKIFLIHIIHSLLQNVRHIMSGPLFFALSTCIICMMLELLAIDQAVNQRTLRIYMAISASILCTQLGMAFVLCDFAENASDQSQKISQILYMELLWYKMTITHQKLLMLPIREGQKMIQLNGFGIIICSMEQFLKVSFFYYSTFTSLLIKLLNIQDYRIITILSRLFEHRFLTS